MPSLRVAIPPSDPTAVHDVRTRWPAEALAARGYVEIVELPERIDVVRRDTASVLTSAPDADVYVITRPLARKVVDLIPALQAQGARVVVDVDDDFRHCPPTLPGRWRIDPRVHPQHNWRHLLRACQIADLVTVSTPALLGYAPHGRVRVLRNAVPASYLEVSVEEIRHETEVDHGGPMVGWAGAVQAHPGDLDVTHGGVAQALRDSGYGFMVVGMAEGVRSALGLATDPPDTGRLPHDQWPYALAALAMQVCPLADNSWTRAKSWLKPLQSLALGQPCVASDSPEYMDLYHDLRDWMTVNDERPDRLPLLVARPRARTWCRHVRALTSAPTLLGHPIAREYSRVARGFVAQRHTVEGRCGDWLEAWTSAYEGRG